MALQKDKLINGHIFNYHKIRKLSIDSIKMSVTAEVLRYKDKEYRDSNPNNFQEREIFTWADPASMQMFSTLSVLEAFGYAYIKIKEPKMAQEEIDGELQWLDDNQTEPKMIDVNFYSDAVDVIETV